MESRRIQKHLFYGALLVWVFIGSLSSVFRDDVEAKVVSVICASILFVLASLHYVQRHRALP